jgi:hypothetical protein
MGLLYLFYWFPVTSTGAFLWYHGTLTGIELSNQNDGTFTSSGSGTLDTSPIPEPGSFVLLGTGLASLLAYRKRALLPRLDGQQSKVGSAPESR